MATVVVSAQAERDIEELADYYGRESVDVGVRFYLAVEATFGFLSEYPHAGRPRLFSNPALVGLRSWQVSEFRKILVFYRVSEPTVRIVRIMHGARDLESELSRG